MPAMLVRIVAVSALVISSCGSSPPPAKQPPAPAPTAQPAPKKAAPSPCTNPERKQFDFWVGTWTVRLPNGKVAGANTIEKKHRGCALIESWTSARGGTGVSTNYWDPGKRKWVQNWVDGTGGIIQLEGGLVGAAMRLQGRYVKADGTTSRLRGTWTPLDDGRVRQLFEESKDNGKTWTTWFDGYYSRTR